MVGAVVRVGSVLVVDKVFVVSVGSVLVVDSVLVVSVVVVDSVLVVDSVPVVASVPPVTDVSTLTAEVVPLSVPSRFVARVTSSVTMGLAGESGRTGAVKSFDSRRALSTEIDWGRAGSGPGPAFTVMLSRTPTGVARPTALPVTGSRRWTSTRPRRTVIGDNAPTTPAAPVRARA